jgi:glycosyltransferase involved in cell wall biosynthesis
MRILQVTREALSDRRYGLGKSLQPVVDELALMGHTTRYLTRDDLNSKQQSQFKRIVKIIDSSFFAPSFKGVLRALAERIQMGYFAMSIAAKDGYSRVHAHDPWIAFGVLFGAWIHQPKELRWGITQHGHGAYAQATLEDGLAQSELVHRSLRRFERWILAKANWVMVPTHLSAQALARDLSLVELPKHWHVVTHALPFKEKKASALARSQLGWKDQDFVVLAVGRIVPLKRFDLLVRVCASLSQTYPNIRLQILGEGDQDGLMKIAEQLGFSERLSILHADDIQSYYPSADLYVSASSTESFGLANLEALCAGLPCVLSSVGGVPEVAGSGGWLIDCNHESLSNAISAVVESGALRSFWRQQATNRASSWPSTADVAKKYESIYG